MTMDLLLFTQIFFSLSLPRPLPDLTVYTFMSNTAGVLYYKQQELLNPWRLPEFTPGLFWGVFRVAYLFRFLCVTYYVCLRSQFHGVVSVTIFHKIDVRFVFTFSCLQEGSCLNLDYLCWLAHISVFCFACLRLVSCVPIFSRFLHSSMFSNVYLQQKH